MELGCPGLEFDAAVGQPLDDGALRENTLAALQLVLQGAFSCVHQSSYYLACFFLFSDAVCLNKADKGGWKCCGARAFPFHIPA